MYDMIDREMTHNHCQNNIIEKLEIFEISCLRVNFFAGAHFVHFLFHGNRKKN